MEKLWIFLPHLGITLLLCFAPFELYFMFRVSGMTTRSQESTTGTSRTKPARVTRRTTSLSLEMEMVFTTMSLRQGKTSNRHTAYLLLDFNMKKGHHLLCFTSCVDCYALENSLTPGNVQNKQPYHHDIYMGLQLETVRPCPLTAFLLFCRVRLSKRRAKAGAQSTTNAVLVCKHRDMNEKELEAQVSVHEHGSFRYMYH